MAPQPPPPFTFIAAWGTESGWRIHWLDDDSQDVIVGWMFGQRTSDSKYIVCPMETRGPVFYSVQTRPYKLLSPGGLIIDPNPDA
jgi:hypothetical protein